MKSERKKIEKVIFATVAEIKTTPKENVERFMILRKRLVKYAKRFKATLSPEELAKYPDAAKAIEEAGKTP